VNSQVNSKFVPMAGQTFIVPRSLPGGIRQNIQF